MDVQQRCRFAQLDVAGKRANFGDHTDEIQKILLSCAQICGALDAPAQTKLEPLMSDVEKAISSKTLADLKAPLKKFVDAATSALSGEDDLRLGSRFRTEAERAANVAMKQAQRHPVPLRDIGKHQAANKKGGR